MDLKQILLLTIVAPPPHSGLVQASVILEEEA